ncbi:FMN binding oxidoreductase [Aspergillus pseudodeflectus]|uniref:FMN binding oxidoreductase n=1 Tax=Aspergillus pseudodeflectus TaxID=176178 RepID=A0ABR4JMU4_9EURO
MESTIAKPLTLNCGLQLKNRLVKAALVECMADESNLPTDLHTNLYRQWAEGGWGMVLTGSVSIDRMYLTDARDNSYDPSNTTAFISRWRALTDACTTSSSGNTTALIMQINHPGRQSPLCAGSRSFTTKNIAPSPVPLNLGSGLVARFASSLAFGTPREMTKSDIEDVIQRHVHAARLAREAGFHGVQLHAAHGYLFTQFLSSATNRRTADAYGGSVENRARIIVETVRGIRDALGDAFCVGIKLNSVDHQSGEALAECLVQLKMIIAAGVDFVEISGGTYEDPAMMQSASQPPTENSKSARTLAREAFFLEFARAIRHEIPDTPLMVTGGFRSRAGVVAAIAESGCDLVGIGRPSVLRPSLPNDVILNREVDDEQAVFPTKPVEAPWVVRIAQMPAVGSGIESKWYSGQMQQRARRALEAAA